LATVKCGVKEKKRRNWWRVGVFCAF